MEPFELPELPRRTIDALGIHTNYYVAGEENGRTVLLLHGMTSSGDAYRELMVELADNYHLIAPDIPGFGFSESTVPYTLDHLVEWVAAFFDALELRQCLLIGHSFGGVLAAHFALAYPEDVSSIVLIAPALLTMQNVPDFLIRVGVSLGLADLGTTITQSRMVVPFQVKSSFLQPEKQSTAVWERRMRDYENARDSANVLRAIANQTSLVDLRQLTHPVCLIWGVDDQVVPFSNAAELMALLPNAELHEVAACGHVPLQEQTAVVLSTIAAFLLKQAI